MLRPLQFHTDPSLCNSGLTTAGAVDMDIYGAFQLCSLGLVAGTLAVRISKTYYATPGRNTIFIWVTLILAGRSLPIFNHPFSCNRSDKGT
jgi:hypothetical protein